MAVMSAGHALIPTGRSLPVDDLGAEAHVAQRPFPVTVVPARLLDGTRP